MYMHICAHVCMHAYAYAYVYAYVCVCVCVCMYMYSMVCEGIRMYHTASWLEPTDWVSSPRALEIISRVSMYFDI